MPSTPPPSDRGVVYDGETARAHPVALTVAADWLDIAGEDGTDERIGRDQLRRGVRTAAGVTVHRVDRPDWRLIVAAPAPWVTALPGVGRLSPRATRAYAAVTAALVAVAALAVVFGDDLLSLAAPLVPSRVARPIGEAVIASLDAPRCTGAAGQAALDRLVDRLRPLGGFVEPVDAGVVDTPAVNAVTAPGGRIAIFRGLIDQAAGPNEVAGVLAHELTNVALRHPAKAVLRQLGGDVGGAVDLAGLLHSSRRAERDADAGALATLRAAHVAPAPLAAFFDRMRREEAAKAADDPTRRVIDLATSYTATHPGEDERAAAIRAAVPRQGTVTAAMSPADWAALRAICRTTAPWRDR